MTVGNDFVFHFRQRSFVALYIYSLEEWIGVGVIFPNILHDNVFIASAQVQIFEPIFADDIVAGFYYRFPVRDTYENR